MGLPAFFGVQGPPVNGLSDPYCAPLKLQAFRSLLNLSFQIEPGGPVGLPAFFGVQGPPVNGLSDPYCARLEPAMLPGAAASIDSLQLEPYTVQSKLCASELSRQLWLRVQSSAGLREDAAHLASLQLPAAAAAAGASLCLRTLSTVLLLCAGVYDATDSQRFFVTIQFFTCLTLHPNCSSKPVFNYLLIATSRTANPLDGFQGPFYVDTSGLSPQTLQARLVRLCVLAS